MTSACGCEQRGERLFRCSYHEGSADLRHELASLRSHADRLADFVRYIPWHHVARCAHDGDPDSCRAASDWEGDRAAALAAYLAFAAEMDRR